MKNNYINQSVVFLVTSIAGLFFSVFVKKEYNLNLPEITIATLVISLIIISLISWHIIFNFKEKKRLRNYLYHILIILTVIFSIVTYSFYSYCSKNIVTNTDGKDVVIGSKYSKMVIEKYKSKIPDPVNVLADYDNDPDSIWSDIGEREFIVKKNILRFSMYWIVLLVSIIAVFSETTKNLTPEIQS